MLAAEDRRRLWAAALTLPGQPDLRTSLVAELADYLGQGAAQVEARCRAASADLARAWQEASPSTPEAIAAFYRQTDAYLYDLTWWHALGPDDSALVQVEALEAALAHHAGTALDFGSGIGSLGLLLARHGVAVTLAEVNPRLIDYARRRFQQRGVRAEFLDLSSGPLPDSAFDFIAAVDVLEHLPDPRAVLTGLAGALRPRGTLFVHLPTGPDPARPMHLWHATARLLDHLREAGLWLERAAGSSLILRRGRGPSYALRDGLELRPDSAGGVLLSPRPLAAVRLNRPAFELLARLDAGRPATEVAAEVAGLALIDTTAFLEDCVRRRLVVRRPAVLEDWPSVSVVVPARGRPAETQACVESLLALDYPADRLEVIVVDDASDPPLAPVLAGLPVCVLRLETNQGQSAARNRGATAARGELLAFIDNDCVAAPDWLRALVPHLDDPAVAGVGGRVVAGSSKGRVAGFEAVRSPLDMGAIEGEVGPDQAVAYLPTCNLLVRRETLLRLGGFDEAMVVGEDVDFVWRLRLARSEAGQFGGRVRYVPAGRVVHRHRTRLGALLGRRLAYGSSEADLQRRHPDGRRTMTVPRVVAALLAVPVVWPASLPAGLALAVLGLAGIAVEVVRKYRQLRLAGVRLSWRRVIGAVLRQHGAALYHLGGAVTRYYALPLAVAGLLWPGLLLSAAVLFLVPAVVDHRRLRPSVALPWFVGLYWLEMVAYQAGVWRGCWQRRTLRPLLPALGNELGFRIVSEITDIELIARGRGVPARYALNRLYGQGDWRKMKGKAYVELPNGDVRYAELHWYEAHGIGRRRIKRKRFLDE